MNNANFIFNTQGSIFMTTALLSMIFGSCTRNVKGYERPNILFILSDDQRADALGCSGNTYIKTPNLDKLSTEGTRFTNAYVMGGHHAAISAPSRAMLMTGKNLFKLYSGLDKNKWVDDIVLNNVTTMPLYFAKYGYETFGTGKWHNGVESFEAAFRYGKNVFIGGMCDHFNVPCQDLGINGKLGEPVKKGFSTDLFADAAIDFINDYAKKPKKNPFFCYVAFTAPHDPRSPLKEYLNTYQDETIPLPGNFKKYHPFAFDYMQIRDETLASWPRTPEIIQASLADYYSLITHLDKRLGQIIETLKENNLLDNTIIVFASDNGLAIGSHGLMGKQNLYEHSIKVPLIIRGPGIPSGNTCNAFMYLYDLFPTLCDLSGLPVLKGIDGKDFVPVIRGEIEGVRNSIFTVYRNTVRAVRDKEWKLIRYPERNYTQLFNLISDPLEINNLAEENAFQSKVKELTEVLKEWQVSAGDSAVLTADKILPMDYNPLEFVRIPDPYQPEYVVKKYFRMDIGTILPKK